MKFQFKIQQYQTDAVDAVVQVFNGQRNLGQVDYIRDLGKRPDRDVLTVDAQERRRTILTLRALKTPTWS